MSLQIGLTGGIGSGKTFISRIFQKMGVPIYNSDERAKIVMLDDVVKKAIIEAFGPEAYFNHQLNKPFLARAIFSNHEALKKINAIVHPAVGLDYANWMIKHKNKSYIIKESAILIENNLTQNLDALLCVLAPKKLRIKRVQQREDWTEQQILERMKTQISDAKRIEESDFTIVNCKSHVLLKQIHGIHLSLTQNY